MGGVLAIGHAEKPESIYDNPQLYPMMFPWLFPYGLGGIGCDKDDDVGMSDMMHKRKLLMYHDKCFQMDAHFPLIVNHEQIKRSTTGGYLLTERQNFDDIVECLMNVDLGVLEDLSKRLYFTVPHGFPWSPHGVLVESSWSPHGVLMESSWTPQRLHEDSTQNPQILWRVHGFWVNYDRFW